MSGLGWELLSSERLLHTPYLNLRSDRMRLPDGAIKESYYVIERQDAAVVFPLTASGGVLLVRQYRPPLQREELGLPAGLVEPGEEPLKAGRRELAEETGYAGGDWEPLGSVASSPGLKNNWAYLYLARGVERAGEPEPDEHERLVVETVPLSSVRGLVDSGEIVSSSGVAAALLALDRLRREG